MDKIMHILAAVFLVGVAFGVAYPIISIAVYPFYYLFFERVSFKDYMRGL